MKIQWLYILFTAMLFATPFDVATYNVENLFDAHRDNTEYSEYIPGYHGWSEKMAEIKLNHTTEVICDIDAEVIALQEIENQRVFEALKKRLKRVGCGYAYGAITHKAGAPIQVALLSRFPIVHTKELVVSRHESVRNILEVTLKIEHQRLTLFVNHWKSKSRRGVESKRMAYARTLAKRIASFPVDKPYLIVGDLNTNYGAGEKLSNRLDDTQGRLAMQSLLHTVVQGRDVTEADMHKPHHPPLHYDLWWELPYSKRWSHKFYGKRSSIDHILLPYTMFDGKGIDYVNNTFRVFHRAYLFTKKGYVNHWEYKSGKHTGRGYSDHFPLIATFDLKPYRFEEPKSISAMQEGSIEKLYTVGKLQAPLQLKDVVVVLKRGSHAVIKQKPSGRGVFVYGTAESLKEGEVCDVVVNEIATYQGLKEVLSLRKVAHKGRIDLKPYYASIGADRQNEVLRNIEGIYRGGYLYMGHKKLPIYFKKPSLKPKDGSKLKIFYAHLGYYKRLQLVIYSRSDFTVLE